MEYLQQAVAFDDKDGHTWEELAYCYLMINDLQNSYTAYQHALYHIRNPKVRRSALVAAAAARRGPRIFGTVQQFFGEAAQKENKRCCFISLSRVLGYIHPRAPG